VLLPKGKKGKHAPSPLDEKRWRLVRVILEDVWVAHANSGNERKSLLGKTRY